MKLRPGILRITAFLMLLIFTQKIGVGLALHNFFHKTVAVTTNQETTTKDIGYACSCVDDFLMPFTPAEEIVITTPATQPVVNYSVEVFTIPAQTILHSTLRGPPAIV